MLSGKSLLKGQKLLENANTELLKWDILGDFQSLCILFYKKSFETLKFANKNTANFLRRCV